MNSRQNKAIHAVVELALRSGGEMRANELAERLGLTREAVHQLLLPLVRQGIIEAGRGRHGGYHLPVSTLSRSVWSVIASVSAEGALREQSGDLPAFIKHLNEQAWAAYRNVFESETVASLAGKARDALQVLDYHI